MAIFMNRCVLASTLIAGASLVLSSCASVTTIPMQGTVADLSALAGEWLGTYESPDLGRQGTIWFTLAEGENVAQGDVRMTPRGGPSPYGRHSPGESQARQPLQFLSVRFVRVSATDVDGQLDRYWDPDSDCFATTVFTGRLYGKRLEGTFETKLATGAVVHGRWRAVRKIYK